MRMPSFSNTQIVSLPNQISMPDYLSSMNIFYFKLKADHLTYASRVSAVNCEGGKSLIQDVTNQHDIGWSWQKKI